MTDWARIVFITQPLQRPPLNLKILACVNWPSCGRMMDGRCRLVSCSVLCPCVWELEASCQGPRVTRCPSPLFRGQLGTLGGNSPWGGISSPPSNFDRRVGEISPPLQNSTGGWGRFLPPLVGILPTHPSKYQYFENVREIMIQRYLRSWDKSQNAKSETSWK